MNPRTTDTVRVLKETKITGGVTTHDQSIKHLIRSQTYVHYEKSTNLTLILKTSLSGVFTVRVV